MVDSQGDVVFAPARSRNILGAFGFVLALGGLAFFWLPFFGVSLWALGIGVSLAGSFRAPRGFGVAGLGVSLICFAFMGYFLVLPAWLAVPVERIVGGEVISEKTTAESVSDSAPNRTLSDILSSFRYPEAEASSGGNDIVSAQPVEEEIEPEETKRAVADSGAVRKWDTETRVGTVARFPVARFAEISKHRTTWPRVVRLTRSRMISLWDSERKEIMGKMEVPAKTVVEVLDVRADGSLFVLDCTGQAFSILAADTDFARVYTEKNDADSGD
ncbi:MAG: hypothetical protein IJW39_05390 [Opitutales bacterium]|nr:hypothetical protein [Opitutales bacterium]